jgi:hypothetical protein
MAFGIPELIILLVLLAPALIALLVVTVFVRRRTAKLGYRSVRAYLRAVPQTDAERRDAADLALQGLVICMVGAIFAPVVLVGLVPLFYGGRKLAYALMGLGLVDDRDQPGA